MHKNPSINASRDYIPALDGLRAIAILLVILSHAGLQGFVPGGLGVLVFFVISGFLLTRQMIAEIEATGNLKIGSFYMRRVFRLAPALLLYIFVTCLPLLLLGAAITATHILSALLYFANYYLVFTGYPPHSPMPILWSLSVEEHFYILFPFCMLAFRKKLRRILPWLCAAVIATLLWRIFIYQSCAEAPWTLCGLPGKERYFGTDMIFDCILYGSLTALGLHYHGPRAQKYAINNTAFVVAICGLILGIIIRDNMFRSTLRFTLQSLSVAVLIVNILYGKQKMLRNILSHRWLVLVGHLSYSLYLFHYGVLVLMNAVRHHEGQAISGPLDIAIYLSASFGLAAFSYYLVEKPMIAVRRRFGAHPRY